MVAKINFQKLPSLLLAPPQALKAARTGVVFRSSRERDTRLPGNTEPKSTSGFDVPRTGTLSCEPRYPHEVEADAYVAASKSREDQIPWSPGWVL